MRFIPDLPVFFTEPPILPGKLTRPFYRKAAPLNPYTMPLAKKATHAPQLLTQTEIADPQRVIDELFDFAHLPDIRELMWEWLKVTVAGTYHKEMNASERSALLSLYEHLTRLVEAAHVLHTTARKPKREKARKDAKTLER
jgi:hypothetical protein